MRRVKILASVFLMTLMLINLISVPAMADRSDNNHVKNAELKNGSTIKGKVNLTNDKVDYYKLNGQQGSNPRFKLTGSDHVVVYVYDDSKLKGTLKKRKTYKSFKIKGTCVLKVVAKSKSKDKDKKNKKKDTIGGGTYRISIKSGGK